LTPGVAPKHSGCNVGFVFFKWGTSRDLNNG